jgi:hypothetical protein
VIVWKAEDTVDGGGQPGPLLQQVLRFEKARKLGDIPAYGYFFRGCRYVFGNVQLPHLGHITNNECTGESIILDEREGPDTGAGPFRVLQYTPKAIIVRPAGPPPPALTPDVPAGCLMVLPQHSPPNLITAGCSVKR